VDKWQTKRILILGTTYPSHSKKYSEIVCTGGIEEDTRRMIRLHPVPMRYLEAKQRFKKFQWIDAKVQKHDSDPRPESFRIAPDSIVLGDIITDHVVRRSYLESSPHLISSLEALKERQLENGTSLGIIKPRDILDRSLDYRSPSERLEWERAEKARLAQQSLFGEALKPLDFPESRFMVHWKCDDDTCPTHNMGLLVWGIHELYRKLKNDPKCEQKVLDVMQKQLDQWEREVFLFLGNFRSIQYNFGLMDSYSSPKVTSSQATLFM
jgi:hypothetical protein